MGKNRATRRRSFSRREHDVDESIRRRARRKPSFPDPRDVDDAYAAEADPVEPFDDIPGGSCLCHDAAVCPDEFTDAYGYGPLSW